MNGLRQTTQITAEAKRTVRPAGSAAHLLFRLLGSGLEGCLLSLSVIRESPETMLSGPPRTAIRGSHSSMSLPHGLQGFPAFQANWEPTIKLGSVRRRQQERSDGHRIEKALESH